MLLPIHQLEPDSAAGRVVDALLRKGPLTVSELVFSIGVTRTAVRQQVDRLLADGWLMRTQRRTGPGRPADVFAVSDKTRRLLAGHLDRLSKLLLEEVITNFGPDTAQVLLRQVTRRMARDAQASVGEGPAHERLARLAGWLQAEGVRAESEAEAGLLAVRTCPYAGLVEEHRELCDLERESFSELVGSPVEHEQCMLDGHACCEFRVVPTRD
jgi:predicted ArsR family transcriptional regulator